MKNILIRCDASKEIGLGHVTRCLTLAHKLKKRGNRVIFAMKNFSLGISKVKNDGFNVDIAPKYEFDYDNWILNTIKKYSIDIFIGDVRDGFPVETIKKLKEKNILTVAIDEPSEYAKECDICFYPPHANIDKNLYKGKIYQGFEYVILRDEFYRQYKKHKNDIPNILVMMGGTDAYNLTLEVVKQLLSLEKNITISVVIKEEHPDYDEIKNLDKKVSVYPDIANMAEFLKRMDFGIISFGVSAYELLLMQIPAIHICIDEDHWKGSEFFEKNGYAVRYKKDTIKYINFLDLEKFFIFLPEQNNIINIILDNSKYIVSIGAGKEQVPLIKEIKRLGYKVISCDRDKDAPGALISDKFYNISTYEYRQIIKKLKKEKLNIVGVLTRATGQPVVTVAKIAHEFSLRALDVNNALLFSNKSLLINKLNELNIPSPEILTTTNIVFDNDNINFPVFVKPSKTVLSHAAMRKCVNILELREAVAQATEISETHEVNIEEYLTGRDVVSIDFIFQGEIIHVTTIGELSSGEPYFDGLGWYSISNEYANLAKQSFTAMVRKLKIKNGFLQTAMKIDINSKSAKIYEVHAEIGGDNVNDVFIPYILDNYNIFEENIKMSVGEKPTIPNHNPRQTIMLFKNKITQYNISLKGYQELNNTFIKDFSTFKELKNELDFLKKNNISASNYFIR